MSLVQYSLLDLYGRLHREMLMDHKEVELWI